MKFSKGGSDEACRTCEFIQATGEIVESTPDDFERFFKSSEFQAYRIRLNSPGGSLSAGLKLGEMIRSKKMATEVGADALVPDMKRMWSSGDVTKRTPGECASACAYAFLGGVERSLDPDSKLGFHRFYLPSAFQAPTETLFTGNDLDRTQRLTAALALYVAKMGVDARLMGVASEFGPGEMRWIEPKEGKRCSQATALISEAAI
ncbi:MULTISPECIES: hypothetical protein [unclassified Chelatococcus]|uniref:COG3904 family protein n=1 Tax=unclassified Chelatococcus TaxID=2638111 RepID=UPI001BD166C0|nr:MULTISPECIES: hypothetical protein [unclassified Chelatococcus]MBS7743519.1 hypothetical protein [Chelatococcus sp. HY11]MBX3547212.1 hypothetical protein [Chelatococcus sp.]